MRNASSRRRISTSFAVWSATLCPRSPPSRRPVRFVHRPDHAANDTCRRNQPSSVATFARVDDLLGFPLATRRTASMQNAHLSALEAKHAGLERQIVVASQRQTGRASCRERGWQYVENSVVAGSLKDINTNIIYT